MKFTIQSKNRQKTIDVNRRRGIRERCLNCSDWSPTEVRLCEFTDCSLYPYRTSKGKQDAKARARAIREYCLWCMNDQLREVSLCPSKDCSLYPYRMGTIDRTAEIKSLPKSGHIEPVSEDKIKNEYVSTA